MAGSLESSISLEGFTAPNIGEPVTQVLQDRYEYAPFVGHDRRCFRGIEEVFRSSIDTKLLI